MKNLNRYFFTFVLIFSFEIVSQESSDGEPTDNSRFASTS